MEITEQQFKDAAKALLPNFIMCGNLPYRLCAHMLMGGSFRILYCNGYLDAGNAYDEQWDDPLDCIKVMMHRLSQTLGTRQIDEKEFEAATLLYNKFAGLKEVSSQSRQVVSEG